jgi:phage shock protein A
VLATVVSHTSRKDSHLHLAVNSQPQLRVIPHQVERSVAKEVETRQLHISSLRQAVWGVLADKSRTQKAYAQALAEVESCEKQLQLAVENQWVEEARTAWLRHTHWQDQAHHLQALMEQQNCQIFTLKNQLAFWEKQTTAASVSLGKIGDQFPAGHRAA